ncbi:potassium channel subfamily K member 9 [Elysia marginata]|uniref:Potassium channel subfamily K member 9 n=1 Tax=Elysia marginata TaxID=1093978 RepID=A0AAV4G5G1_9GAST|nr:potassium channel subfamily K member 9 [Elysia marginata]
MADSSDALPSVSREQSSGTENIKLEKNTSQPSPAKSETTKSKSLGDTLEIPFFSNRKISSETKEKISEPQNEGRSGVNEPEKKNPKPPPPTRLLKRRVIGVGAGGIRDDSGGTWKLLLGILVLVFVLAFYVNLGATTMMLIEGKGDTLVNGPELIRENLTITILDVTNSEINELEKMLMIDDLLLQFQRAVIEIHKQKWDEDLENNTIPDPWSYPSALLFTASLVTTVGYGNIAPATPIGQIFTVIYCLIGVPLTLACITIIGVILARIFRTIIGFLRPASRNVGNGRIYVPLWISLGIMFLYLGAGSFLFYAAMNGKWSLVECFYFCFITLSTIGLGDYVYGATDTGDTKSIGSVAYMLVGFSLVSMCFNLMGEEVMRKLNMLLKIIKTKFLECLDCICSCLKSCCQRLKNGHNE